MSQAIFEITIILLLIILNGVFAMSEIAVVSARRVRLEQAADDGSNGAKTALALSKEPERFLSTVQIGITLIGIFAGAFGGARLAQRLAEGLAPLIGEQFASGLSLALVVGTITYLSVVIGELVPKQIALQNAERIAAIIARPMQGLAWVATPIVLLLSGSTTTIVKLLGIPEDTGTAVTEEEIRVLVEQGAKAGIIDEAERDMVEGVFRLGDYQLEAVLTPRPEIVWLDINASEEEIRAILENSDASRYPVSDGHLDNVIGVVRAKSMLSAMMKGEPFDLKTMMRDPIFMPESMPAIKALELFKQTGTHLAMIVDEYGSVEGVVTLYDILEAIVGDIPTPDEIEEPRITTRTDGSWLIDGLIQIQDFKEYFDIDEMPSQDKYQTLGGFMVTMSGHIPQAGEHFGWGGFRFEVADMDGKRVDKILLTAAPDDTHSTQDSSS